MATRKCTKCQAEKPVDQFYLNCYGRNGACKTCVAAKNKAYYEAKRADIAARHKERSEQGCTPDIGAQARRVRAPFADRYAQRRASVNTRKQERLQTDPQYRALLLVDTQFRRAVAQWGESLSAMVSCDVDQFREWIASQFAPMMAWDNYGTAWVYDHVDPKSNYDMTDPDQVIECYRWENLRPLTMVENSQKHNKSLTKEETIAHENNIRTFKETH